MRYFVDRTENSSVILIDENGNIFQAEKSLMPTDILDGSVLIRDLHGRFSHDYEYEALKQKSLHDRIDKLKNK